ncbi:MAG: DNA adenine methylase [Candidatus Sericytochromatia bacterium]|nr:DNA adenine methylase [Candidatus Sericytochromatia bacterium]
MEPYIGQALDQDAPIAPEAERTAELRIKRLMPSRLHEALQDLRFRSLYEPFAGQCQISRYFKRQGKRVFAGDLLEGHYCMAKALIANNDKLVSPERLNTWQEVIRDPRIATRFSPWAHQHFTPEETIWLGIWNAHLAASDVDVTERALGATAVAYTMRYWLSLRNSEIKGSPLTPSQAFSHYVQTLNAWVFNNGVQNRALWGDAYQQASRVEADLLFCYPPTHLGFHQYPLALTLFEGWLKGDPHLTLPGQVEMIPGPPTLGMSLTSASLYAEALRRFLSRCTHIPLWVVAYHEGYLLDETAWTELVGEFRTIVRHVTLSPPDSLHPRRHAEKLLVAR